MVDYEKMRYEAGWKGFKEKDYGKTSALKIERKLLNTL